MLSSFQLQECAFYFTNLLLNARPPAVVDTNIPPPYCQYYILSVAHDGRHVDHPIELILVDILNKKQLCISLTYPCIII